MIFTHPRAALTLDDATLYPGFLFGARPGHGLDESFEQGPSIEGNIVVSTDMFGYQRQLTDPAHRGHILVMATPQIGNVGWNDHDNHPDNPDGSITAAGIVIRDLSVAVSHFSATGSLEEAMITQGVTGIAGVDTRSLIRRIARAADPQEQVARIIVDTQRARS